MRRLLTLIMMVGLVVIFYPGKTLQAEEDEMDEELRSTISSDPVNRGRRSRPPSESASPPPSSSSSSSGDEEDEWQTMRSEGYHRRSSYSPIKIDLTQKKIITPRISFESNSAVPTAGSQSILKRVAAELNKRPELMVRIDGHTDSIGYDQENLTLSQKRADSVRDNLVQQGVTASRLQSVGMGDRYPVASSTTKEGQEKNRRVEFVILEAAPPPAPVAPPPQPPVAPPAPAPVIPTPPPQPMAIPPVPPQPAPMAPQPVMPPQPPVAPSAPSPMAPPAPPPMAPITR